MRIGLNFAPPSLTQEAFCCAFSVLSPKSGARLKTTVQLVASVGSWVLADLAVNYKVNGAEHILHSNQYKLTNSPIHMYIDLICDRL